MRDDKKKAIELRRLGLSYSQINTKLKIPKSTLSGWLKTIKEFKNIKNDNIRKAKITWAKNIIAYNKKRSKTARAKWLEDQEKSAKEIEKLSDYELKIVGAALYWAEGYKRGNWSLVFCNSDPEMLRLIMKFFLRICEVPLPKIKAQVQIHPNVSARVAVEYWSRMLKFPKSQFLKPICQLSKSSKLKRKNNLPYGTLRIKINDVKVLNRIKGWIKGLAVA